jgi:hypothetical protein
MSPACHSGSAAWATTWLTRSAETTGRVAGAGQDGSSRAGGAAGA